MVVRMFCGGGVKVFEYYLEVFEVIYLYVLGLKVIMFLIFYDIKGLMLAVIEDNDLVIFLEYKYDYCVFK